MATIYTIGHSTRTIEEFIELLTQNNVVQLVDIRTIPRSRHNPQYEQQALQQALTQAGLVYKYEKDLGGLRPKAKESINQGWRNQSFRNYADYMQTEQFSAALKRLMHSAEQASTAIMCAEAVPWRCHRSLVADALTVRDYEVREIISQTEPRKHTLTSFAVVSGTSVTYPSDNT